MPDVPKHAWTHRPRSQGGTDPIEFPAASGGSVQWAKAWMSQTSISNSGSYFRAKWQFLGTSDASLFELVDVASNKASWLQINEAGYYEVMAGINAPGGWGANYTNLEIIYAESGTADFQLSSAVDLFTDFTESDYSAGSEQDSDEFHTSPTTHIGLWKVNSFRYDPSNPGSSDLSDENPLKIACRVTSDNAGPVSFSAALYVKRLADAAYTLQDVT